mmetsp:Transcript_19494/g.42217  ORF Transcript_19494/g.42217 Transcript_19494/m.42217 type:complete len:92 (+) Transcript_19494:1627-1902(+)
MNVKAAVAIALITLCVPSLATRFIGKITVHSKWHMLANYVLDGSSNGRGGTVNGSVYVEQNSNLVFYDDDPRSYPWVQNANLPLANKPLNL